MKTLSKMKCKEQSRQMKKLLLNCGNYIDNVKAYTHKKRKSQKQIHWNE